MITTEEIKTAIYTWMARESGLTCIFERQGKPRPVPPYGTILVKNAPRRVGGIDELRGYEGENVDGDPDYFFNQQGQRVITVTLNIFGNDANATLGKVRDSIDRPDVIEEMELAGLAIQTEDEPTDLTALEDTKYLERSQIDLTVSYVMDRTTETQPILELDIELEIETDKETIITETFEIVSTLP